MATKVQELITGGFKAVVTGDRVAHSLTGNGDCWQDEDHLIPLTDVATALEHGYTACPKCAGEAEVEEGEDD